jgi:hypothetical protein
MRRNAFLPALLPLGAAEVKIEDPSHPVFTALAGAGKSAAKE